MQTPTLWKAKGKRVVLVTKQRRHPLSPRTISPHPTPEDAIRKDRKLLESTDRLHWMQSAILAVREVLALGKACSA